MPITQARSLKEAGDAEYSGYGQIVTLDGKLAVEANNGTAQRTNWLCGVVNHRLDTAVLNLCHFDCEPPQIEGGRITIATLERHDKSTQVFMSLDEDAEYLVVVCRGDHKPDFSTLRAFKVSRRTMKILGISYLPGVWHSGFIALKPGQYLCLVNEAGTTGDTTFFDLEDPIVVIL